MLALVNVRSFKSLVHKYLFWASYCADASNRTISKDDPFPQEPAGSQE